MATPLSRESRVRGSGRHASSAKCPAKKRLIAVASPLFISSLKPQRDRDGSLGVPENSSFEPQMCWFSVKWRATFPVREYIAISTAPVWAAQSNVVGGGQGTLLKLQLVSKRNQVGWSPPIFRPALTQGAHRKTKLPREGINYHAIRQAAAHNFGKRCATTRYLSSLGHCGRTSMHMPSS